MPEALLSATLIVLAIIGFITVVYAVLIRWLRPSKSSKYIIVLPFKQDEDLPTIHAFTSMLKSHPLFSPTVFEIVPLDYDKINPNEEKEV